MNIDPKKVCASSVQCRAIREQVARLEGEKAALAAALRGLANFAGRAAGGDLQGMDAPTAWLAVSENASHALSDGGEGWLPPEVREQAREALEIILRERGDVGAEEPVWVLDPAFDIASAALDALKGE